jgi:uncharacterized protein YecE (DUF72 family)
MASMRGYRPAQPDLFGVEPRSRAAGRRLRDRDDPRRGDGPSRREPNAAAPQADAFASLPNTGSIRIGTSGYSFLDWIGPFYPPGTPRPKMLDHYQRHFRTVEVNATYYRIPPPSTMARMAERTRPGFDFMVKLPGELTHKRTEIESPLAAFRRAIEPLEEAGKFSGALAQFPFSFHRTPNAEDYLRELRAALRPMPVFVEFRHASWDTPDLRDALQQLGYGFCSIDEPALPGLIPRRAFVTGETAYVRLHGRNARDWWGGGGDRYNYLYSRPELEEWADIVRTLANEAKQTYVFFNNCHAGHAVVNARMMEELLRIA